MKLRKKYSKRTLREMKRNLFTDHYQYVKWKCAPDKYDDHRKPNPIEWLAYEIYVPLKKRYNARPSIYLNLNGFDYRKIPNENLHITVYTDIKYARRVLRCLTVDSYQHTFDNLYRCTGHMNRFEDVKVIVHMVRNRPNDDNWYSAGKIMINVSEDFHNGTLPYFSHESYQKVLDGEPLYGD